MCIYRIAHLDTEVFLPLEYIRWVKLQNNVISSVDYSIMEPIMDTIECFDIHSKLSKQLFSLIEYVSVVDIQTCF